MSLGWEAIRAEVLRRIRTRIWEPGEFIPNEAAMAREFGVARATVNRALRELAAAGVLERRRKAGTRVALNPVRKASFDIPVIRLEVEGRGQVYGFELLAQGVAVPPVAVRARLRLGDGALLHLRTLHRADGEPWIHEDRWLNTAALPAEPWDFSQISANEWLVRHVTFSFGDIAFFAEGASEKDAKALGVASGQALFVAERTTWAGEMPITLVRLAYAPGYRMQTVL